MKVAIQGFSGSFHAQAALKYFGGSFELVMCDSFIQLFKVMKEELATVGVMAIENTIAGTILYNYTLLRNSGYKIIGETFLKIEHFLLALPGQTLHDIKEVRSHPMALMQCAQYFADKPWIRLVEDVDTAYMAELISKNHTKGVAAIAGQNVAGLFGLSILESNIEDSDRNFTRFLIIKKDNSEAAKENNKATLSFSLTHEIGGLKNIMTIIADHGLNVTSFQSTPFVGNAWEYFFHMDVEFDAIDIFRKAVGRLKEVTINFNILGEYKKGV